MTLQKYQNCIDACADSIVACKNCANEDLQEEDVEMLVRCVRLNHDGAAVSILAMQAMASNSEFVKQICSLCAEICNVCADECEKYTHMEHCKICAEVCRKCAVECSKI